MNLLITQNSQNLSHSHTTNTLTNSSGTAITTTGNQSANPSFSGSASHSHALASLTFNGVWSWMVGSEDNNAAGLVFAGNDASSHTAFKTKSKKSDPLVQNSSVTISGTTTGNHNHNFEHKHGTTSNGGIEVRPVDYTYKIWKRTA